MTETMNEKYVQFANEMNEYDLLDETNPNLLFLGLRLFYVMMVSLPIP